MEDDDLLLTDDRDDVPERCAECRRKLDLGDDLFTVEAGVLGPRGVVPLGAPQLFCGAHCIVRYFGSTAAEELEKLQRRVP